MGALHCAQLLRTILHNIGFYDSFTTRILQVVILAFLRRLFFTRTAVNVLVHKELATNQLPMRAYCETCRLLPESVVWLCANNRVAEAEQIIRNAAKLNNITMPDKILAHSYTAETLDDDKAEDGCRKKDKKLLEKFRSLRNSRKSDETKDGSARYTMLDIFRNRHLTINMFCMVLLWSVIFFTTCTFYTQRRVNFVHTRAAWRLVRARVLCQMRAPYRPITAHKIFHSHEIAGPQNCRPGCCSTPSTPPP